MNDIVFFCHSQDVPDDQIDKLISSMQECCPFMVVDWGKSPWAAPPPEISCWIDELPDIDIKHHITDKTPYYRRLEKRGKYR